MSKLKILSLGRNLLKKIEKLEDVASTLEELWVSYNQISTLDGISVCTNLATLYISNNTIKSWAELDKLVIMSLSFSFLLTSPIQCLSRHH
jgi:dynein light chain 1, axonemal